MTFYTEKQAVKMALQQLHTSRSFAQKGASQNEQAVRQIQSTVQSVLGVMDNQNGNLLLSALKQAHGKLGRIIHSLDAYYYSTTGQRLVNQLYDSISNLPLPKGIDRPGFFNSPDADSLRAALEKIQMTVGLLLDPKVQSNPMASMSKQASFVTNLANSALDFEDVMAGDVVSRDDLKKKLNQMLFNLGHMVDIIINNEMPILKPDAKVADETIDNAIGILERSTKEGSTIPLGHAKMLMRPVATTLHGFAEMMKRMAANQYGTRSYRNHKVKRVNTTIQANLNNLLDLQKLLTQLAPLINEKNLLMKVRRQRAIDLVKAVHDEFTEFLSHNNEMMTRIGLGKTIADIWHDLNAVGFDIDQFNLTGNSYGTPIPEAISNMKQAIEHTQSAVERLKQRLSQTVGG